MGRSHTRKKRSRVFYNEDGYIEIQFFGIVRATELLRVTYEMNQLADVHGPIGVLLDGRHGRLHHDAGTLITLSEYNPHSQLTHMIVLTHTSANRRDVIVRQPTGLVTQVSAQALKMPLTYICKEAEARRLAAHPPHAGP